MSLFSIEFGSPTSSSGANEDHAWLNLNVPLLHGPATDTWIIPGAIPAREGSFVLAKGEKLTAGAAVIPAGTDLTPRIRALYRELFQHLGSRQLYRVWHYLPRINEEQDGLERYRHFNAGRWEAFEEHFGPGFSRLLPAASAVGAEGDSFALFFLAGDTPPELVENPLQAPSWQYPACHGPKAPGFARGATAPFAGTKGGLVSGTASILGHESVGQGDLSAQLEITLQNLHRVLDAMNLPEALANPAAGARMQVYLRNPHDLDQVLSFLSQHTSVAAERIRVVHAAICRVELDVEIELLAGECPLAPIPVPPFLSQPT